MLNKKYLILLLVVVSANYCSSEEQGDQDFDYNKETEEYSNEDLNQEENDFENKEKTTEDLTDFLEEYQNVVNDDEIENREDSYQADENY